MPYILTQQALDTGHCSALDRSAARIPVCSLPAFRAGRSQAINKPSQSEPEQLEMARDGHEAGVIQG